MRPIVLSIGTTEPWAAAGTQLDLFIADRLNIRLVTCVLAVSAQDGEGAFAIVPMNKAIIHAQLSSLDRANISAIRIGAMHTKEHVEMVTAYAHRRCLPIVLDPVIATSAGGRFLDNMALGAVRSLLMPQITLLTPNIPEAEYFANIAIQSLLDMEAAARKISAIGAQAVLVKGGHTEGAPVDVLWDGTAFHHFTGTRLPYDMRGTGCVLAIACAAALAHGQNLHNAIQSARDTVQEFMLNSRKVGVMRIAP